MIKRFRAKLKRRYRIIFILVAVASFLILGVSAFLPAGKDGDERLLPTDEERGYYRMLLAGRDRASGLYDVLMLVSVDMSNGGVCVMQIPRDTYLEYTGRAYKKINGAPSSLGGVGELKELLSECMGIGIDSYIQVDLDTFAKGVDALGGVEVELPETFYYNDPAQGLYIHLTKGKHLLCGEEAEQFVRYRSGYVRGDLGRLDAQKIFMSALFEKISTSMSLSGIVKLAAALLPDIRTDMGIDDIASVASAVMGADPEKVIFVTAPGEDTVSAESGAWYYVLSASAMSELLEKHFGGGEFDTKGLFLNESNPSSQKIYNGYSPYFASSSGKIEREGLNIE